MESPPVRECIIDGRSYLYFGGTSYLGLHGHPEVIAAACEATRRYGIHPATSRSLFGNTPVTLAVERLAAEFFDLEDAFYFVSGYRQHGRPAAVARAGFRRAVSRPVGALQRGRSRPVGPVAAGPISAARRRGSATRPATAPRPQPAALGLDGRRLAEPRPRGPDRSLLRNPGAVRRRGDSGGRRARVGDDRRAGPRHAGFFGPLVAGRQRRSGGGDRPRVPLYVGGTLSKALGGFGGIVPGSAAFLRRVRTATHYYDGASAPATPVAAASACALQLVRRHPELRLRLRDNVCAVRNGLRQLGLSVEDSPAPIVPVQAGSAEQMQRLHAELKQRGILVPYMATYSGLGAGGRCGSPSLRRTPPK